VDDVHPAQNSLHYSTLHLALETLVLPFGEHIVRREEQWKTPSSRDGVRGHRGSKTVRVQQTKTTAAALDPRLAKERGTIIRSENAFHACSRDFIG
jgi:hypothetical protein